MAAHGPFREATVADAGTIAMHRAMMFREMGLLSEAEANEVRSASEPWLRELIVRGDYCGWLMECDGSVIGGGGFHLLGFGPKPGFCAGGTAAHIANIYVEPAHRRQGLADGLMKQMIGSARARGVGEMTLSTSDAARAMYARLGFVPNTEAFVLKL